MAVSLRHRSCKSSPDSLFDDRLGLAFGNYVVQLPISKLRRAQLIGVVWQQWAGVAIDLTTNKYG